MLKAGQRGKRLYDWLITDKGRRKAKNGGTGERGARRTTHLIEATYVAYGDVRCACDSMKTRESGIASDRGARRRDCVIKRRARKDPEMSCRVARYIWPRQGRERYEWQRERPLRRTHDLDAHEEQTGGLGNTVGRVIKDMPSHNPLP